MDINDKLEYFRSLTIEETTKQSEQILKNYQDALDKIFEEHKQEKIRQADLQIKAESEQLKRSKNIRLSQEQLALKRDFVKKQNQIREKIFVELKNLLGQFTDSREYNELLINQINEAKKIAKGEDIIIYIDPADSSRLKSLEVATNSKLEINNSSFLGGTRAFIPSKNILIDNSFETKLADLKSNFPSNGGSSHEL